MSQLFGFQINRKEGQKGQSPVPPNADEAIAVAAGGYYGTYVDTENQARNEFEMIRVIVTWHYTLRLTVQLTKL